MDNRKIFLQDITSAIEHIRQANSNLHVVLLDDQEAVNSVREAMKALEVTAERLKIDRND